MNVEIESGGMSSKAHIESDSGKLHLSTVTRTNGLFINVTDGDGTSVLLHTTIEFGERLARAILAEVEGWKGRVGEP